MPTSTLLAVTRQDVNDVQCQALFVSRLQPSDNPTTNMVAEAIIGSVRRFGPDGCAGQMAQEFGDHPDAASGGCAGCASSRSGPGVTHGPAAMTRPRDRWRHERHV